MATGIYTARRKINWEKIRGIKAWLSLILATALGAGLLPFAPGTMGTLIALPLAFVTRDLSWFLRVALWLTLTVLGTWAAKTFDEMMDTHDNQNIVIDEVVGLGITSWVAQDNWKAWIVAFLLFRFFDIIKLPPVRQIDRWSQNRATAWWGGFGVIADDIMAGFQGLFIFLLLQWLGIL